MRKRGEVFPCEENYARKNRSLFFATTISRAGFNLPYYNAGKKSMPARDFYVPLNTPSLRGAFFKSIKLYETIQARPLKVPPSPCLDSYEII